MRRWIEFVSGLLAAIVGLLAVGIIVAEPEPFSVVEFLVLVVAPGLLIVGVALGAYLHGRRGIGHGAAVVQISTGLMCVAVLLLSPVRWLFLPAAFCALVAAVASRRNDEARA